MHALCEVLYSKTVWSQYLVAMDIVTIILSNNNHKTKESPQVEGWWGIYYNCNRLLAGAGTKVGQDQLGSLI